MAMDMTTALTIKANVVGQSQITGLQNGLGKVTTQTNKAAGAMGRFKAAAGGALGAMRGLLPALGVGALAAFAKRSLDAADSLSKMSQRTGVAVPALDKFRQAANLSDTSIQSLERAFPALTKNMDMAAQKGKGPAFEAFQRLGVAVKDSSGNLRDADAVMLDIADRFNNMADGSEKAALASAVFGTRIGSELIPMLNMGGDAVRGMSTVMTQEMADKAALVNDKITMLGETFNGLGVTLTAALLPVIEAVVGALQGAIGVFNALPGPLQSIVAAVAALSAGMVVLVPLVVGISAAFKAFAALKIGATIAGFLPAIVGVIGGLKSLGLAIAAVFTGPVGWVALAVAAGVAIFKFRNEIGQAFGAIGNTIKKAAEAFNSVFVEPVVEGGKAVYEGLVDTLSQIGQALRAPFEAAANMIKGIVNGILNGIGNAVGSVVSAINRIISGANRALARLNLPQIPLLPTPNIPQFAKGGMVTGPTLGLVGEAGPEYIVPARKAQGFAQNIMNGVRGPAAIPRFAEGGFVSPSASVNIQTGPVTQMNGQNFVTANDMSAAVQSGVEQTLELIRRDGMIRAGLAI
jgi:hypothetical protein|tara:strand:- start:1026 stop:2756 length:1731 start_codon:yes stop_codon:yes gene_type:complete